MIDKVKEAYSEILNTMKKHKDVCVFDIERLEYDSKCHILGIELKHKYGFDINPKKITSYDYIDFNDHMKLCRMGEKYHRTISWSDDDTQPEDELLLTIRFPTGAYIFGDDYPKDLFEQLFLEMKTYKPKYIDSKNNSLFFALDNAGKIFNDFNKIMKKYNDLNVIDSKQRKIQKMKDELARLEQTLITKE